MTNEATPPPDVLRQRATDALARVIDPEIGLDVVALGLVYRVEVEGSVVHVDLTMTTPACPLGEHIALDARRRVEALPGVSRADVRLVWDPPWTPDRLSPEAREALGW